MWSFNLENKHRDMNKRKKKINPLYYSSGGSSAVETCISGIYRPAIWVHAAASREKRRGSLCTLVLQTVGSWSCHSRRGLTWWLADKRDEMDLLQSLGFLFSRPSPLCIRGYIHTLSFPLIRVNFNLWRTAEQKEMSTVCEQVNAVRSP